METVSSKDGTSIAFDRIGDGPPIVLVSGGSVDRGSNAPLAQHLASDFTAINYDRRGRGPSGDTPPYAVQREIEDIDAVIDAAGGSAFLYGSSSGASLALEAAAAGSAITKLALWEPPWSVDASRPRPPEDTAKVFADLVEAGRREDAVEHFMSKVVGLPPEFVEGIKQSPYWAPSVALAHTLAYDATIMGDYVFPRERLGSVAVPTIVLDGGASFGFMGETAQLIADLLPNAERRTLEGQEHNVDPAVLAPAVAEFFSS